MKNDLNGAAVSLPSVSAGKLLAWAEKCLLDAGVETPSLEARILLGDLLSLSPTRMALEKDWDVEENVEAVFRRQVLTRSQRIPLAYVQEKAPFLEEDFYVDSRVLIPRPETELLVERSLEFLKKTSGAWPRVLDLGTGSGCVAASLAKAMPALEVVALDFSPGALDVARENAARLRVAHRIRFFQSDLYGSLGEGFRGYFDMIISNPPYVAEPDLAGLAPELHHEPKAALNGGPDGLSLVRPLIQNSAAFLKPKGRLALEIGEGQSGPVAQLMKEAGYTRVWSEKDLSGIERNIFGEMSGSI